VRARGVALRILICALGVGGLGCPPDLDFRVVGGGPGADGGGPRDGDVPRADGSRATGGPCALPMLLVTVEDLDAGATTSGVVMRFSLGPDEAGPVERCGDLTGQGMLGAQAWAATRLSSGLVAVASPNRVDIVDEASDAIRGAYTSIGWPIDAFTLRAPPGEMIAIADGGSGLDYVRTLTLIDPAGAAMYASWALNDPASGLLLGLGVRAMSASPVDPSRLLALSGTADSAAEIIRPPYDGAAAERETYASAVSDTSLRTVYGWGDATYERAVWVGTPSSGSEGDAVYYAMSPGGVTPPLGPVRGCDSVCAQPLSLVHAIPDPTLNTRFIAICAGTDTTRHVVRFKSTDSSCERLLDGTTVGFRRPTRLAVSTF